MTLAIANPNQSPHSLETVDRALCSQDRRHLFNMTAIAGTPQFDNRVLRALASDWQLAVINRILSGAPQTIVAGTDRALTDAVRVEVRFLDYLAVVAMSVHFWKP